MQYLHTLNIVLCIWYFRANARLWIIPFSNQFFTISSIKNVNIRFMSLKETCNSPKLDTTSYYLCTIYYLPTYVYPRLKYSDLQTQYL